jgi:hypothetical protein
MPDNKMFFKPSRVYWWKGYYVPVRNSWSQAIEKKHLSHLQKETYESKFGQRILSCAEFDAWLAEFLQKTD